MLRKIYDQLASLNLGLWLMGGICLLMAVGSFSPGGGEGSGINDVALFRWLGAAPLSFSWWLWLTIGLLALLAVNTTLCSIETLRRKYGKGSLPLLLAPQAMHLGFLLIILAHLFSAQGGVKEVMEVVEGSSIGFPDGSRFRVGNLQATVGKFGMPTDFSAELRLGQETGARPISPNHPVFHQGYGIYLKHLQLQPFPVALVEIHREPGAALALAGALLFTIGNVVLVALRRGR